MIRIERLAKRFGGIRVLRELSLEVARGRVTAVVGPNASGKTTLIKTIVGLTRPDGGTITVGGVRVNGDEGYRAAIGYMPQIARFPDNMTAHELFALVRDMRAAGGHGLETDDDLARQFGIDAFAHEPLRTLSGGTRQKVNAALAFLFHPALLLLDEPTAGLDPVASRVLKDKILAVRAEGRTVVVTSHVMSELEELADDVALIVDGELRYCGDARALKYRTQQPTLERAVADLLSRPQVAA